jgi:CTP:phosphocholine cytidylyltransferase-like protein/thiamine kinase-like enzyme
MQGISNQRNAIILAAGKSTRFAPFTYERPKGLFRVKGEVLIERQVEQMIEAGIAQIIIVVGYMKEKFFYLERKYPQVKLVVNNKFGAKGNLYSLYVAKEYLSNTYLSYADYYFATNPFLKDVHDLSNRSYRACVYRDGKFDEFACCYSDAEVITSVTIGGCSQMEMLGHAYFNESFCYRLVKLLDEEIDDFRISSLFWEEYYKRHLQDLTLYVKTFDQDDIVEFNSIDDLRQFDVDFLYNVDSEIITNICQSISCNPNDIKDIAVINAGLTNVSFKFRVNSEQYVYRHPGGTSGNLIDRKAEKYAQYAAKTLEIDRSMITMSLDGWKLSYCVQNLEECDFRKYDWQLQKGMEYLRKMHAMPVPANANIKTFDDYLEGIKLMKIASATKGNLLVEFAEEISKAKQLDNLLKSDANRLGYSLVCCHNDVYEPNFLATQNNELYLIDWEYAGLNYAANDLACFFCRYEYSTSEIDHFLSVYLQHTPSVDEHRFYVAYIALCAFYWMSWGLYKGSVGDDDGFFFLPAYRNFHRFIDTALESYEHS